jgi:H+/Cl- antiporter ClcA
MSEIKAILAGYHMPNYLAMRTLISKFFGVTFARAGGLSLGKSGPLSHVSVIIVH